MNTQPVPDQELRKHLTQLLTQGQAHATFKDALEGFPVEKAGLRPGGSPHSAWELLEHIRIALEDIALFSGIADEPSRLQSRKFPKGYVVLNWPGDYWPKSPAPADTKQWNYSVTRIEESLQAFLKLIEDPKRNLFEPFPWGDGQTLLREALLIADHNAWHLGQLLLIRRMLER